MPESIIKRYYDELGKGNLVSRQCNSCGLYTFPPTTACEHCGSTDLEWVSLSGKGKLLFASHGIDPPPNPRYSEMAPYVYGHIILEEGIPVQAIITGVDPDPDILQQYYERGPVEVEPDILKVKDLNVLAFKIVG
jgi:uncharacterized OB-fold protein